MDAHLQTKPGCEKANGGWALMSPSFCATGCTGCGNGTCAATLKALGTTPLVVVVVVLLLLLLLLLPPPLLLLLLLRLLLPSRSPRAAAPPSRRCCP